MSKTNRARIESAASVLAWASTLAVPATVWAQETQQNSDSGVLNEVVVTGSRVVVDGSKAPTPVTVLGGPLIEQRGAVNVADVLNELPSFRGTQSGATTAARTQTAGANFADLRGLGTSRTLTLVDGHRFVPAATTGQVDLNLIPSMLIERVEVVTGGASATYGSDAVAGVVNLILDRDFRGLKGEVQRGRSERGDNDELRAAFHGATSFADDRGYFSLAAEYVGNDGVGDLYTRDWGREQWGVIPNPGYPGNGLPQQLLVQQVHNSIMSPGGLITAGPLRGTAFAPDGTPYDFQYGDYAGSRYMSGGEGYDSAFGKGIPLAPEIERRIAYLRTGYQVSDSLELTLDYTYGWSRAQGAAAIPFDYGNLTISSDNAYIPAAIRAEMLSRGLTSFTMGRFSTDIGVAPTDIRNETQRVLVGAHGDFAENWSYGLYYQYGRNDYLSLVRNSSNRVLFREAIDAVVDPTSAEIVCRSTLTSPANGCRPFNPFGVGNATPQAYDYVTGTQSLSQLTEEHVIDASVSGQLLDLPAGPLAAAFGAEYREEKGDAVGDEISALNQYYYGNAKSLAGSFDVKEGYVEFGVPVLADLPLVQSLQLNLAGRWTDYSVSGSVETWKVGASWEVTPSLRLRVTRSRDIRAPNISDLYTAARTQPTSVFDPVTSTTGFVSVRTAGSTTLEPEKADTFTIGAVLGPDLLGGARLSVDYYDIDLNGAITSLTAQGIVDRCFAGETALCALVTRDGAGGIAAIDNSLININTLTVRGLDIELSYPLALDDVFGRDLGTLNLRAFATHTFEFDQSDGSTVNHLAGMSGDQGVPSWIATLNLDYQRNAFSALLQTRFISSGKYQNSYTSTSINDNDTPSATYVNLSLGYQLRDGAGSVGEVKLFGVINNLLDKDPVIAPPSQIGVTNLAYYDVIGRTYRLGVQFSF